jgi:hypothetical protein
MYGSKLVNLMKDLANKASTGGFEIATVLAPMPDIKIKIDNTDIILNKTFLFIAESLLDHTRKADGDINISSSSLSSGGDPSHNHSINSFSIANQSFNYKSNLDINDKIIISPIFGGQKFLILDKVVDLNE